ncbi:MAG: hypothetical protein QOI11_1789 [Candidatus Eremiobacteraeota bacterium]|nr:hypothetical protein [Candidatus Eremiobacteraeota bacterium]
MNFRALAASAALLLASPSLLGATAGVPGLRSSGTLVLSANLSGEPLNVGGNVALYHKGALYRIDVLSLGFPGTSSGISALASSLIRPGGVSLLYDGATGAATAWSSQNKTYYLLSEPRTAPAGPATPTPAPSAPAGPSDPLAGLTNFAANLHDIQSMTIQLTGHKVVNGHPTSDIDVQMKRQAAGKPLEDYHAQLALAEDLGGFPVQIAFASVPPTKQAFGGTVKLDLTSVVRETPDDAVFKVPAGYTRVTSLSGVLGHSIGG